MTCVFNTFVVVGALIAGAKRYNGRAEDPDRAENGLRTFWGQNGDGNVLRLRSTGGNFGSINMCTWYRSEACDDIGVNVSEWFYYTEQKRTKDEPWWPKYYWKFGQNDSLWRYKGRGMEVQYLLYQEDNSSCAVIKSQYYMFAEEDLKNDLVQECKDSPGINCIPSPNDPGKLMCGDELKTAIGKNCPTNSDSTQCEEEPPCMHHPTGPAKYLCRDHTSYNLLVSEKEHNVPPQCDTFYKNTIGDRRYSENADIDGCKPTNERD